MYKIFLPFALFTLLLTSCCKEGDGELLGRLILGGPDLPTACDSSKATPFADRFSLSGQLRPAMVADGSKVLLATSTALYWTDLNMGKVLKKSDSPVAGKAFCNTSAIYRHGDLAVAASGYGLAAVNVKTAELAWEHPLEDCEIGQGVYGLDDQYFVVRTIQEPDGVNAQVIFSGDLHDGQRLDLLCTPVYSRMTHSWAGYGEISALAPFSGADGHTYLLISFFETRENSVALDAFLALYDVTARTWVYERQSPLQNPTPTVVNSVQQITVSGAQAYLCFQGKILVWDIATGTIVETITKAAVNATTYGYSSKLQVNDRYILAPGNNYDLEVLDNSSHALLYRIDPAGWDMPHAEFDLDRMFIVGADAINVYEISTGRKLETIVAPCEQFGRDLAVWKDIYGAVHVTVQGGSGRMYHYVLQE